MNQQGSAMGKTLNWTAIGAAALVLALLGTAQAADPAATRREPIGVAFPVDESRPGATSAPAVAVDPNGDFVVAFRGADVDGGGVFARLFRADGVARGADVAVNTTTAGDQQEADIAMTADGRFVVTWSGPGGIYARMFWPSGEPLTDEIQVATSSFGAGGSLSHSLPAVATNATGDFVVSWSALRYNVYYDIDTYTVYARRFASPGLAQEPLLTISTTGANGSDVAMADDGRFVVVAHHYPEGVASLLFKTFAADGTAGASGTVNSVAGSPWGSSATVGMDADGDFVVAWGGRDTANTAGVVARRFGASGAALDDEIMVSPVSALFDLPSIAIDASGDFTISWIVAEQGNTRGRVLARSFRASGTPDGKELRLDSGAGRPQYSDIGMDDDGNFVIAWDVSDSTAGTIDVWAQRVGLPPVLGSLGLVDAGSATDLAVLQKSANRRQVHVRDSLAGTKIANLQASIPYSAVDFATLPDGNANGVAESAILGQHETSGAIRVAVLDGLSGAAVGTLANFKFLNAAFVPLAVRALPDFSGNGKDEVAVLGRSDTGQLRVQVRDGADGSDVTTAILFLNAASSAVDLQVLPDGNGNGAAELALLGRNADTGINTVQIRDAATGAAIRSILFFDAAVEAVALALVPDQNANGKPELAVLGRDTATGVVSVQLRDAANGALLRTANYLTSAFEPVALVAIDDADGDGEVELAVLGCDRVTGTNTLQLREALSGANPRNFGFSLAGNSAEGLAVIADATGNGAQELVVLSAGTRGARLQVRDAQSGALLSAIVVP